MIKMQSNKILKINQHKDIMLRAGTNSSNIDHSQVVLRMHNRIRGIVENKDKFSRNNQGFRSA